MAYDAFLLLCQAHGIPTPETEYAFAAPERKWRFDYSWPAQMIAVEREGGVFARVQAY